MKNIIPETQGSNFKKKGDKTIVFIKTEYIAREKFVKAVQGLKHEIIINAGNSKIIATNKYNLFFFTEQSFHHENNDKTPKPIAIYIPTHEV